jgi:hypothetical protein
MKKSKRSSVSIDTGCIKSMHGMLTAKWSKLPEVWRSIIYGVSFVVIVTTVTLVTT